MKGYKFYLEYPSNQDKRQGTRKELGNHLGNVIAVVDDTIQWNGTVDVIGAIFFESNSPVALSLADLEYISEKCKRISEKKAREIHPALFEYLDTD